MNPDQPSALLEGPKPGVTLAELYERGNHYAVLNAVLRHLETDPGNAEAALFAFRSYTALGLIGPACEMLEAGGSPLASLPEFRALRSEMARLPPGRLPWTTLKGRFEANAARLYARHPDLRQHDETFRSIPNALELYRSVDGNLHLSTRLTESHRRDVCATGMAEVHGWDARATGMAEDHGRDACATGQVQGGRRWLPNLCDTKGLVAGIDLPHHPKALFCNPYLILGDRFGAVFERVHAGTPKMLLTFTPRIYLIEPDIRSFGVTLHVAESVDALCDERVSIFVGPDCVVALSALLQATPGRAVPDYILHLPPQDRTLHEEVLGALGRVAAFRQREAEATITAARGYYDGLPRGHWSDRFRPDGGRLRVLGLTSRFTTVLQYSMRDLKAAFERRGHEFRLLIEENDHDLLSPTRQAGVIREFRPDLLVVIDHLRCEYADFLPAKVPYLCWIQDMMPHLHTSEAGLSHGPLDFYIAPGLEDFVHRYDYPASQGMVWTMATNDQLYSAEPMPADALAPHRCDVSCVSNQSKPPWRFHEERREIFKHDPAALGLADCLYEMLDALIVEQPATASAKPATLLVARAKQAKGLTPADPMDERRLAELYIHPLLELMFRHRTLAWVADYCDRTGRSLHLYGNGWEEHPRFARYARGSAENGRQLRAIHQASRINLQVTSYGAIHQRLLDGLASGGFFLIRYSPFDVVHRPIERLMGAIGKYGISPDVTYCTTDVPEASEALGALAALRGELFTGPDVRIPVIEFDRYRSSAEANYPRVAGAVFARYEDVAFRSADEFAALADRFLADGAARQEIVDSMRATVLERYTYDALVRDILAFLSERLGKGETIGETAANRRAARSS